MKSDAHTEGVCLSFIFHFYVLKLGFMTNGLAAMYGVVQQIYSLNAMDWAVFVSIWQPFDAKRKTILTASCEV